MRLKPISQILSMVLLSAAAASAAEDVVMKAMRDELARSMKKLQLESLQKPYFVAYREVEQDGCTATASFGALISGACVQPQAGRPRSRNMSVEVRVGDYARDNTNFYAFQLGSSGVIRFVSGGGMSIPLDDNYDEIRRQLWVATDSAYKTALDVYAKKKAALEHRTRTDEAPDFSKEQPVTDAESWPAIAWDRNAVESQVKALSALFRSASNIENSEARFNGLNVLTRYVNSEGTSFTRQASSVQLVIAATTQAVDGMPISDFDASFGRSMAELPTREEMAKRIREMQARIEKLRVAPLVDRYNGPVLFEGQAAAEIVLQAMGNAVIGMPRIVVDDSRFERLFASDGDFADKIGNRVLPDFLSLIDNASLRDLAGRPLMGGYQVDEDGVKSRPFTIIDKGYLKGLLRTRALIPNTAESTASRRGPGPTPSNLLLTSDKGLAPEQLKARFLEVLKQRGKEYGMVVRRINNAMIGAQTVGRGNTILITNRGNGAIDMEPVIEAYKLYADGREELVRNVTINGLTIAAFKDIVAVSDAPTVYTVPFRIKRTNPSTAMSIMMAGPLIVSVATPSLLFEDLALARPTGEIPHLPVTPHPSFAK